ncbi:MAG: enoyl-CoA hydratase/isomerase family protein [Acidimicrobiales bacterium]
MTPEQRPEAVSDDGRFVRLDRRDDGVALVQLDRPKMNALSGEVLRQLRDVLDDLAADLPGAVVVWGGPRIFAAGADVAEFNGAGSAAIVADGFRAVGDRLVSLPRMVIAAVNGYALGGGCELALACDMRVVADNATFGQPEILLGVVPGGGGTQRLARLIGPSRAKDLIVTGRQVRAEEAKAIGLADRVVPRDEVLTEAVSLARTLATGAVAAQALAKRAIDQGLDGSLADGLDQEKEAFVASFETEDATIGIQSFLAHGPNQAEFTGR